jgi:anti-anti-sigma regulatory factor
MGSKFRSDLTNRDGVTTLKVAGVIDEDNELASLEGKLGGGATVLDLAEIERINSCGVRDWVNWLGRIEKQGARLVFVNCSPQIVSQLNLVHNFTANGIVKSFYAPYFCARCKKEKLLRLEARDLAKSAPIAKAPLCRCDECDGAMDFDELEESYFAFLNNAKKIYGDASFEATLKEIAAAGEAGAKMKARVSGANIPPVAVVPSSGTATPTGQPAPSSVSPTHRTPTPPTPPTPTGARTPALSAKPVTPSSAAPRVTSSPSLTASPQPQSSLAPRLDGLGSSGSNPTPSIPSMSGMKPVHKPIVPWILLSVFLLAAAGLLAFALLR